ncbi:MAG: right-handed parallel beta-helix repeat-containing protein [Kosmotoga sp.]|nr:MAG: right-handed parallel beta-helix repeat-containing protein [Kosmotoga sp.]
MKTFICISLVAMIGIVIFSAENINIGFPIQESRIDTFNYELFEQVRNPYSFIGSNIFCLASESKKSEINGNTYYISPSGNDGADGSLHSPWKTPYISVKKLKPGDTLIFLDGEYIISEFDEIIIVPGGEENAWITLKGEEGKKPTIKGMNDLYSSIILSDVGYIRIENLEITSKDGAPFRDAINAIDDPINHIVLKDLYIHHIDEFGINFKNVSWAEIIDCTIEYCGFGSIGGPEAEAGGWRNIIIDGCDLSYNGHYYMGIADNPENPYSRPDGFGIEPSEGPIEIRYTTAQHNLGDGLDSKADNTYIHHCLVSNNYCNGVKLWGANSKVENVLICGTGEGDVDSPWCPIVISYWGQPGATFELVNVTVADTPSRPSYSMTVQYDSEVRVELTIKNCIFANTYGAIWVRENTSLDVEYNHFFRPEDDVQLIYGKEYTYSQILNGSLGPGNTYGEPLFINPKWGNDDFDYHLQSGSPAIDSGTSSGAPSDDLDGIRRPKLKTYDKGCYEFH